MEEAGIPFLNMTELYKEEGEILMNTILIRIIIIPMLVPMRPIKLLLKE